MTNTRLHREILKQQLMNYDYSNTPENIVMYLGFLCIVSLVLMNLFNV